MIDLTENIEFKSIPIDDIILLEKNPRVISDEDLDKLCKDIESDPTFLIQRPPLLNRVDGKLYCYAGHQRIRACTKLGRTHVTCFIEDDVPEHVQDERMLKDNLHRGKWDQDKLLELDFGIDQLHEIGLTEFETSVYQGKDDLEEDDWPSKSTGTPKKPKTKRDDVYELGAHRLMCGDSTNEFDVATLMGEDRAQLIFTDPPYMVDYHSSGPAEKYQGTKGEIFNDNLEDKEAFRFYVDVLTNLDKFSTDNCPIYWWFASAKYPINSAAFETTKWHLSQQLIWVKESMVFSFGVDFHRCYEPCLFGWKSGKKHFRARDINDLKDVFTLSHDDYREYIGSNEELFQRLAASLDVWYENRDNTSEYLHPTQKPVRLAERALRKHSLKGFIVLDLFGGSGSTLIACEQVKRKARVMELDPKYCDIIVMRYVKYCREVGIKPVVKKNGRDITNQKWLIFDE